MKLQIIQNETFHNKFRQLSNVKSIVEHWSQGTDSDSDSNTFIQLFL
jgi:hypothetical protein